MFSEGKTTGRRLTLDEQKGKCNPLFEAFFLQEAWQVLEGGDHLRARQLLQKNLMKGDLADRLTALALSMRVETELHHFAGAHDASTAGTLIQEKILEQEPILSAKTRRALSFYYSERAAFDLAAGVTERAKKFSLLALEMAPAEEAWLRARAYFNHAVTLITSALFHPAEEVIETIESEFLQEAPHLAAGLLMLKGDLKRFRGEAADALPLYERALEFEKNNKNTKIYHSLLLNMAKCCKTVGQYERADMYLTLVENGLPTDSFPRFNSFVALERVDLLIDLGHLQRAEEVLQEVKAPELPTQRGRDEVLGQVDLQFVVQWCATQAKLWLQERRIDRLALALDSYRWVTEVTQDPLQQKFFELTWAQYLLSLGRMAEALEIAKATLPLFEEWGLHNRQLTCYWLISDVHLSRGEYEAATAVLRRKMALEIRFAYHKNFVHSSLLLSVASRRSGEAQGSESILLNALKVAHRVHLCPERAAIYKLLGEEQNYLRELSSLDRKGREQVENFLCRYEVREFFDFDLVVDQNTNTVLHRELGTIAFGNKFTLMKILSSLAQVQGEGLSKEELAEKIWGRAYNPLVDDSSIYIHVNRLRKVLELDPSRPRVIINTPRGYMLHPEMRVRVIAAREAETTDRFPRMRELLEVSGMLTSKQLQDILKVPKATLARELHRWVDEGRLVRVKREDGCSYRLPEDQPGP